MELIIGGFAQGKLGYVLRKLEKDGITDCCVLDETFFEKGKRIPDDLPVPETSTLVINHVHLIIRDFIGQEGLCGCAEQKDNTDPNAGQFAQAAPGQVSLAGSAPEKFLAWKDQLISLYGIENLVFISDEVGCGVIPVDKKDREYREAVGRTLCELAAQASSVERIICGIAQKIK